MAEDTIRLQDLNNLLKNLRISNVTEYRSLIISIDIGTAYSGYVHDMTETNHRFLLEKEV
jgi:hypothetical protein